MILYIYQYRLKAQLQKLIHYDISNYCISIRKICNSLGNDIFLKKSYGRKLECIKENLKRNFIHKFVYRVKYKNMLALRKPNFKELNNSSQKIIF